MGLEEDDMGSARDGVEGVIMKREDSWDGFGGRQEGKKRTRRKVEKGLWMKRGRDAIEREGSWMGAEDAENDDEKWVRWTGRRGCR